jgi:CheY-like chemotaxis protein
MSHELRTPLNAILGFGQMLELGNLQDRQRQAVEQIPKGGRHLLGLINEILDISRIEAGTLTLSIEPVAVAETIEEAVDLVRPLAAERSINLASRGTGEGAYTLADNQRVKRVLLNLLSNAVKYNREGGSVSIRASVASDRVSIEVADTGQGIPADHLDRIFVPFERLGAEETDIEGTGLGLALTKRLVEAMDGRLSVESTVGEGSRFRVELPATQRPAAEAPLPPPLPTPVANGSNGHPKTVLYVEDNLSNLKLIEEILAGREDLWLISAMQGTLGLELAREHSPDLILLDVHLPDLPGTEVLTKLRSTSETATIPVVILSADATPGQIERAYARGADAYLTKPIDVRLLLETLDAHLNGG